LITPSPVVQCSLYSLQLLLSVNNRLSLSAKGLDTLRLSLPLTELSLVESQAIMSWNTVKATFDFMLKNLSPLLAHHG
jgi:hypothetical protein